MKLYTDHNTLWVKHATHQNLLLHLQYKVCQILYKMVSAPSFPQDHLCIQPMLQSPPKNRSSTSVNFYYLFHPYLFTKTSLQSPPTSPSSIPQQFFTFLFLRTTIQKFYTQNIFPIPNILSI